MDEETATELLGLRADLIKVYEDVRRALREARLRGGDLCLLTHPIKAPFLEMYDSLTALAAEIERGEWKTPVS